MKTPHRLRANTGTVAPFLIFLTLPFLTLPPLAGAQGESVCVQCHAAQSGRGAIPVKPWRESIHAANGISCSDCHGGDPKDAANAMNPAHGFLGAPQEVQIPSFCGRCHVGIKEDYLQSAHGRALGKGGPTCVTCHGSHEVKKAELELINEKSCSRCHSYDRAARIKAAMQETEGMIVAADRKIHGFRKLGIETDAYEKGLYSTRNRYHRLFHDVDTARIVAESARIRGEVARLNGSLSVIDEALRKRKLAGGAAVGLALLAGIGCYLLKKTYD